MVLLAGDIGGTKTRLALFDEGDVRHFLKVEKFVSKDFSSLSEIVHKFLEGHELPIAKACFGVAGPVVSGTCTATNLPWIVETKTLAAELGTKHVWLLNDLECNAHGLHCLKPDELVTLQEGDATIKGNRALISAGTGLGEAGLYWDGKEHRPFSSEGGHGDFAPRDEMEMELLRYLKKKFDHISYERVLSGPGLYHLYRFFVDMRLERGTEAVTNALAGGNPPAVITEMALSMRDRACERALEWFVSLYGAEAGNLALKFLALGGLYIGGGIAPKILSAMQDGSFMQSFLNKGRFSSLLATIPVKIVLNDQTALLGAASYAQRRS